MYLLCVYFQLILFIKQYACFNLDTSFPIIYKDVLTQPAGNNYFGYSIILHADFTANETWIQIGAPKGGALDNKKGSGIIYRCKLLGPCNIIDLDANSRVNTVLIRYYNSFKDKFDGAWIGGSMDIDEIRGRYVVCGYRWINIPSKNYFMQGLCYWSHVNDSTVEKIIPFYNRQYLRTDYLTDITVYYYGQGQAGMAAHFSNSLTESELILGAPSVNNWDGTVLIYRDSNILIPSANQFQYSPAKRLISDSMFASLNVADPLATTQTYGFGLFGYSLTSGYFFNKSEIWYASGAPCSTYYQGQVLVFKFSSLSDQALEVNDRSIKQGEQFGEYFGAALAAGDLDKDGLDDLIVGSPFYADTKYNQGRIFVFLGSLQGSLKSPQKNAIIEGNGIGGQFGMSLMYLGDFHKDGKPAVAVSAPYENGGSGVVYIYKSNLFGLENKPSQTLRGIDFIENIRGFGISISKPTDMDNNLYKDIAIGAYLSNDVVLLRGKPIVTLQQTIKPLIRYLERNTTDFQTTICYSFTGNPGPPKIKISRRIVVDEILNRAYLNKDALPNATWELDINNNFCESVTINIRSDIKQYYDQLTVSVISELVTEYQKPQVTFVNMTDNSGSDQFCKNCPILNQKESLTEESIALPFDLGCGDDNFCTAILHLDSKFENLTLPQSKYVLGSTNYLKLEITVTNYGENAYKTQVLVNLPKSVNIRSTPTYCQDHNSSLAIICDIDNPLSSAKNNTISIDIDVKEIDTIKYGDVLYFTLTVLTTSNNTMNNVYQRQLHILKEADITIYGKASQQSYSYNNDSYSRPNFTHIYQIEKLGVSPIDEVLLTIMVPTKYFDGQDWIEFAEIYKPEGTFGNQQLNCKSTSLYIIEDRSNVGNVLQYENSKSTNENMTESNLVKRSIDEMTDFFVNATSGNETALNTTQRELDYAPERIFFINCDDSDIIECASITCLIGPLKIKQNIARLQVKIKLNTPALSAYLQTKDIIGFSTTGLVEIKNPPNFIQSGDKSDQMEIFSVFVETNPVKEVELWIIIVAVVAGILLLIILIGVMTKMGFFKREKKMELEALKKAEDPKNENHPTELCLLDWQLSRLGSPVLDLSYFMFTCTDRNFREHYYEEIMDEYYNSLSSFLKQLGSDPEKLFPRKIFNEHLKKYSLFGLSMSSMVLFLMSGEVDEIPDFHNPDDMQNAHEKFQFKCKNIEKYYEKEIDQFKQEGEISYNAQEVDENDTPEELKNDKS